MLQGEFDFEDHLYPERQENFNSTKQRQFSEFDKKLIFWTGQILFGVLGCVLTLVLIDVFLGYTVSDITVSGYRVCN